MAKGNDVDLAQAKQISIIVVVSAVVLNVAFYFLSQAYYEDRAATHGMATADAIMSTRIAFGILTAAVGAGTIIAQFSPRLVAHGLAGLVGLTALIGAFPAGAKDFHIVLPIALGLLGVLMLVLMYFSLSFKSRGAWSFLTATCAVGALITLFGATKIRNATDINLFYALILPGILVVATVMLIHVADEYAET